MKKRILIFSLAYFPHVGGAEVSIKEITDRIPDIDFEMITLRFSKAEPVREQIGNVLVHRVGNGRSYISKILFIPNAAGLAISIHKTRPFDGAWAMMSYMIFPLVLMRFVGVPLPYVLNLQDGDPAEHVFKRWYIRPFMPLLSYGFRHASIIQTLSTYLEQWAQDIGYTGPIEIIPNGANGAHFQKASPASIGKKEGEVWLVTSSRLVKKNAVDDVISALALLPAHVKFLILGDGPEAAMLRTLTANLKLEQRIIFKGHVTHDELPAYLHACDIFIRPSRSEGFGASFVEAMAAGLPIIATQEGGIADFLFDRKRNPDEEPTGFAVDKNSPYQIAEQVLYIMDRPEEAKSVAEHARAITLLNYDWNVIAHDMDEKVLQKL
jgi:glycosyltransferase involved in cell wall biosynthesis